MLSTTSAALTPQQLLTLDDPQRLTEWAERYEHGESIDRSTYWAVRLYCRAARKGHPPAQYALGWLYANGRGVERDDALAAAWFQLAARRGHAQAERMLGLLDDPRNRRKARCKLPLPAGTGARTGLRSRVPAKERRQVREWVEQLAPQYGLEPALVLAVIEAESGFDRRARSIKNAQGLMQLIPETAARFGVSDAYDPVQNLHGGMAYLRWLLGQYQGDVTLALAGYNAGEKAVEKYDGVPPFAETRAYVAKILRRYGKRHHPTATLGPISRSR